MKAQPRVEIPKQYILEKLDEVDLKVIHEIVKKSAHKHGKTIAS